MAKVKIHPAAEMVPPMQPDEYDELKASIAQHGLVESILLHKGQVLDGRHRQRACDELGIEPDYLRDDDLIEFGGCPYKAVRELNKRRNITASQKALMGARLEAEIAKEVKRGRPKKGCNDATISDGEKAQQKAAKQTGTSARSVAKAKKVLQGGCKQLQQAVNDGRIDVSLAEKVVKALPDLDQQQDVVAVAMVAEKPARVIKESLPKPSPTKFNSDKAGDTLTDSLRKHLDKWPKEYWPKAINLINSVLTEYKQ